VIFIKKVNKLKLILIASILFLISFTSYCMAKYQVSSNIVEGNKVAMPILKFEGSEAIQIDSINTSGKYRFSIKNYDDKNVSDVSQNYIIEIKSNTNKEIEFKLYRDNKEVGIENKKTKEIHIENSKKIVHEYELEINYLKDRDTSETDIVEDVYINVHSVQEKI